ncbi:MAG: NIPSNAP family protein [Burkholderiales bacterium]
MIYELRIYHAIAGKLPALNARFQNHTLKMWEKFGIRQVGFWTALIGDNNNDLYYILEWKDLAEREQKWNAFVANPDWLAIRAETEKDGPLVTHISNLILAPTAYSKMK